MCSEECPNLQPDSFTSKRELNCLLETLQTIEETARILKSSELGKKKKKSHNVENKHYKEMRTMNRKIENPLH